MLVILILPLRFPFLFQTWLNWHLLVTVQSLVYEKISLDCSQLNFLDATLVERSISENEAEKQNYRKLNLLKMERRAKNREKLMAMKRFSGFLKRPEILGTQVF